MSQIPIFVTIAARRPAPRSAQISPAWRPRVPLALDRVSWEGGPPDFENAKVGKSARFEKRNSGGSGSGPLCLARENCGLPIVWGLHSKTHFSLISDAAPPRGTRKPKRTGRRSMLGPRLPVDLVHGVPGLNSKA